LHIPGALFSVSLRDFSVVLCVIFPGVIFLFTEGIEETQRATEDLLFQYRFFIQGCENIKH